MINKLKEINEKLIVINKDNEEELKKQLIIKKILEKENAFLSIKIEYAYAILRDLHIKEEDLKGVYLELIEFQE